MSRLDQLFQFLEAQPDEPFLLFAVAKEYERADDAPKALEFYLRLHQTTPQYVGLYYHLGKLYERAGDLQNAIETYGKGIEIARAAGDQHALNELAAAKLNLDDSDE